MRISSQQSGIQASSRIYTQSVLMPEKNLILMEAGKSPSILTFTYHTA
jgi:hypothetical protein